MIRSIFVSVLFFFGPALLMFMLRNLFFLTRAWLRLRKIQKKQEHEVIDITPHKHHGSPSQQGLFHTGALKKHNIIEECNKHPKGDPGNAHHWSI